MAESGSYDHLFKILLIGEPGVGKSSLLRRYVDDTFAEDGGAGGAGGAGGEGGAGAAAADYKSKFIEVDGAVVKLHIWDTSGPRRFKGIAAKCLLGAQGFLLVYDVTRKCSLRALKRHWLKELDRRVNGSVRRMLVANKCDEGEAGEEGVAEFGFAAARKSADKRGIPLMRASAKTSDNVREVFASMAAGIKEEAAKVHEGYESIGTLLDRMHAWERAEDARNGAPEGGAIVSGAPEGGAIVSDTPEGGAPEGGAIVSGTPEGGAPEGGAIVSGTPEGGAPEGGAIVSGAPEGGAIDNVTPAGAKKGALNSILAIFYRL